MPGVSTHGDFMNECTHIYMRVHAQLFLPSIPSLTAVKSGCYHVCPFIVLPGTRWNLCILNQSVYLLYLFLGERGSCNDLHSQGSSWATFPLLPRLNINSKLRIDKGFIQKLIFCLFVGAKYFLHDVWIGLRCGRPGCQHLINQFLT